MKKYLVSLSCLLVLLCLQGLFAQSNVQELPFKHQLEDIKTFEAYQGEPINYKYGSVKSLKVVYEIEDKKLYYISSLVYRFHYEFCDKFLGFKRGQYFFNNFNYSQDKNRSYYLANINYYESQDLFTLEFSTVDEINEEQICELYESISQSSFIGNDLRVLINSNHIAQVFKETEINLPHVTSNDLYGGLNYQPLNKRTSYGYLRKVAIDTIEQTHFDEKDIAILNGTPNDIELTAGVITQEFQTPLSHIRLLCQNRKIPMMALKKVWDDPQVNDLLGKLVYFEVKQDSFVLRSAEMSEAKSFWAERNKNKKTIKLKAKKDYKELVPLERMSYHTYKVVGSKAANLGELAKVNYNGQSVAVPEGAFAIPFYYYFEHLEKSGVVAQIDSLAAGKYKNYEDYNLVLSEIRTAMKSTPVNPELIEMVEAKIIENGAGKRMRFRSSTNAEDLENFNGAGLYTSKTGIVGDSIRTVEKAIQNVWASTWFVRAYQERAYFNIPQNQVAMGILVHRSFPNEYANGVAITKNLYRQNYYGAVINAQLGEVSVVNPPEGVVCDQLLCYEGSNLPFFDEKNSIEYITLSSINGGKAVLTDAEVLELSNAVMAVKKHFYRIHYPNDPDYGVKYFNYGLDIEFKFDNPDRKLYLKQVRPF